MYELLQDIFAPWSDIVDAEGSAFSDLKMDRELAQPGPNRLGFNYETAVGSEREYVFSVVRWMALKVGRRRRQFQGGLKLDEAVPYWRPDGLIAHPVLVAEDWEVPPPGPLYSPYGVPEDQGVLRELAWYHIPSDTRVWASTDRSVESVREAVVQMGLDGAKQTIKLIGDHISRLEALWTEP